ncbi:MAG: hypothetical protein L0211_16195 [Planctomycetaceae bacterium]|nr:hypothetical protein [Planctomycetaceae bacterium]
MHRPEGVQLAQHLVNLPLQTLKLLANGVRCRTTALRGQSRAESRTTTLAARPKISTSKSATARTAHVAAPARRWAAPRISSRLFPFAAAGAIRTALIPTFLIARAIITIFGVIIAAAALLEQRHQLRRPAPSTAL